jgi:hypothetical protein
MLEFLNQAGVDPAFLSISETEYKTFTQDAKGNLIITYQSLDGSVMNWDAPREQTSVIGSKDTTTKTYTRKRLVNPLEDITGQKVKYLSAKGQPTRIFFNGLHAFNLFDKEYLVITEGEKKAFIGCSNNIPTVGLQGIHQAVKTNRDEAGQKYLQLHSDILPLLQKLPNLKQVYLLFDGDLREGSIKRKSSFASAVLNFSEATKDLDYSFKFSHIKEGLPKGLDDLLIDQPDCWAELSDDFYTTNLTPKQ